MKTFAIAAIASTIVLGAFSGPATAQPQIQFGIGPDGRPQIGVRDPERERYERREYWRERRDEDRSRAYEQGRRDALRDRRYGSSRDDRYGERCRTITVREENEWGRMVTRRIRRCG